MKRVLLIGIILAILILAMPQGVLAATKTPTVIVNAGYAGADLTCTPSTTIGSGTGLSAWDLTKTSGNNNFRSNALSIAIESTRTYHITAQDNKGATNEGLMTASDTAGLHVLANPFQMQMGGTGGARGSAADIIRTGSPLAAKEVVTGLPAKFTFQSDVWQQIADTDWSSTSPYSITILFTCSNDWS
jgi:hypothetical protein